MRVRTDYPGRGPRILLDTGDQEWSMKLESAIRLRDALTDAIDEVASKLHLEQAAEKAR